MAYLEYITSRDTRHDDQLPSWTIGCTVYLAQEYEKARLARETEGNCCADVPQHVMESLRWPEKVQERLVVPSL